MWGVDIAKQWFRLQAPGLVLGHLDRQRLLIHHVITFIQNGLTQEFVIFIMSDKHARILICLFLFFRVFILGDENSRLGIVVTCHE